MPTPFPDDDTTGVDRCIAALQALKLVWGAYGSGPSPQSQKRVNDILDMLVAGKTPSKSLRRIIADALRANFGTP